VTPRDVDYLEDELARTGFVALYGIHFATDAAEMTAESRPALEAIGSLLQRNPDLHLHVVGHTDNVGRYEYNLDLSQRRAASVVQELMAAYGVAPGRLHAVGVGPVSPVDTTQTESPETGEASWVLWLSNATEDDPGKSIYFVRHGNRPETGTFPIVSDERFTELGGIAASYVDLTDDQGNVSVVMGSESGGSITITHSSSDRMSGSFNFQASGARTVDGEMVGVNATLTGDFDARRGHYIAPPAF
jgi:hypothetical protein